ncbi:DUF6527 family protein [Methylobacterium aerolatum]|uniref:Uncharacterized protein n=2 Tax=Methylobacterium aerolatum TaxID=418708 RepID=A0ABU0I0L1_9HYPH|nr:DUF6527 family protein [Methylobacterium aerolatum]MDQ0448125.1 hypothetical protein [Methylobacterium aerolatum]GJD34006.1 hypothetical protein FMGBMHLM_0902 [Methylobacterium aerolatum]
MHRKLAKVLKALGLLRYDLLVRRVSHYPRSDEVEAGELVHVVDGGVEKWACFHCPGACGAMIPLNLNPKRRPRWSVKSDWLLRPSISPSVHQQNDCACHFWIRSGRVDWCADGRPRRKVPRQHR